jgi:hypothetical protein
MRARVDIRPLSVNAAWRGRRFKTTAYMAYERDCLMLLPNAQIPEPPYELHLIFALSHSSSDWDNPIKPFVDILQKKYGFNDKLIKKAVVDVLKVNKGDEFIDFTIQTLKTQTK